MRAVFSCVDVTLMCTSAYMQYSCMGRKCAVLFRAGSGMSRVGVVLIDACACRLVQHFMLGCQPRYALLQVLSHL